MMKDKVVKFALQVAKVPWTEPITAFCWGPSVGQVGDAGRPDGPGWSGSDGVSPISESVLECRLSCREYFRPGM